MKFERIKLNSSIEKRILTASIVSTGFLERIYPVFHSEYLENLFIRKVMIWVTDYYTEYKKAPSSHIKDIYIAHQKTLSPEESEIRRASSVLVPPPTICRVAFDTAPCPIPKFPAK